MSIDVELRRMWEYYSLPREVDDPELNELLSLMRDKLSGEPYDQYRYFQLLDIYTNSYQY